MSFATAFGIVFAATLLAEMADKSQLVVLTQAARGRPWIVWLAASAAFLVLVAMAVVAGATVARFVSPRVAVVVGGGLFLALGFLSARAAWKNNNEEEDDLGLTEAAGLWRFFGTTFGLVFLSEFGDKTQLALLGFATALGEPLAVGLGAWAAESLASLVGALLGGALLARVPRRLLEGAAGAVFLVTGIVTLAFAFGPW